MSACEACWMEAFRRSQHTARSQVEEYDALRMSWHLGGSSHGVKRIHAPCCPYAKERYVWAEGKTADELIDALVMSGAIEWHDACKRCLPELSGEIAAARYDAREADAVSGEVR